MSKNFPVKLNVQMRTAAAHVRPPHKFYIATTME